MATTENRVNNPAAPASEKQIEALKAWGAKIPLGLNRGEAHDWLWTLISKKEAGMKITADDLAEPPQNTGTFVPASQLPTTPTPAPHAAAPNGPAEIPAPSMDGWATAEEELTEVLAGGVTRRRVIRFSDHFPVGMTYVEAGRFFAAKAREALSQEEKKDAGD
jgi:hypothetical protein